MLVGVLLSICEAGTVQVHKIAMILLILSKNQRYHEQHLPSQRIDDHKNEAVEGCLWRRAIFKGLILSQTW